MSKRQEAGSNSPEYLITALFQCAGDNVDGPHRFTEEVLPSVLQAICPSHGLSGEFIGQVVDSTADQKGPEQLGTGE